MGALQQYFDANPGRPIYKWRHYFDIYERHFSQFTGKSPTVIEIGIGEGGSLQMWADYFGSGARIIGFDINAACRVHQGNGIEVVIGDQSAKPDLEKLRNVAGWADIVIDDGGHTMHQQIITFEVLFPILKAGGIYLVEDVHTSYWPEYGGGYRHPGSFVEYAKSLMDAVNGWHHRFDGPGPDAYTFHLKSISCYDSILVFEKGLNNQPETVYAPGAAAT